jgi:hypothetical protein
VPFDILLRTFDDMVAVARPSVLNIRNLILVVCVLLLVVFAVLTRGWILEHKVRRQTAALAALEQRRSRILEDINGSRPLAEIIEEIAELVSFKLNGAPCWCQIADGARLGNCPPDLTALRIVHEEITARSGKPLGTLFAAPDPLAKPAASTPICATARTSTCSQTCITVSRWTSIWIGKLTRRAGMPASLG